MVITTPTSFNATLAAQNTSLGGTVTDSNGNPLSGAEVDLLDSQGVPLWTLITDSNGVWSTAQLPPGDYSVKVSLLGFFPVVYPSVTVAAGAPAQQSTSLTAAGTDDFSSTFQALSQIPGILSPAKFYNYLKAHDPTPVADPRVDIPLPGYNFDCPAAKADITIGRSRTKNTPLICFSRGSRTITITIQCL